MSLIFVDYRDRCCLPIWSCQVVWACLKDGWATRTVSGLPFVEARVTRISKVVTTSTGVVDCNTTGIDTEICEYQLEINDNQFIQNPATLLPYQPTASDISSLIDNACFVKHIVDAFDGIEDHVLDVDTVAVAKSAVNNTQTISLPIKDRIAGVQVGTTNAVIDGATISGDNATSTITHVSGPGAITTLNLADLIENAFDGVTIDRNVGTGKFEAVLTGGITVATTSNCSTPASPAYYVGSIGISGTQIQVTRYPEHKFLSSVYDLPHLNYLDPASVATLQTGDSTVKTPAYREYTIVNPSSCRSMEVIIEATGSFAAASTAGTGFVVFGHSLWVGGSLVTAKNGRKVAGYNISWPDGIGLLQDFVLPTIKHKVTLTPGQSVVVGVDFGDNEDFATIGTCTALSLESRQLTIQGHTI